MTLDSAWLGIKVVTDHCYVERWHLDGGLSSKTARCSLLLLVVASVSLFDIGIVAEAGRQVSSGLRIAQEKSRVIVACDIVESHV